jgi:hypothetical protein
MRYTDIADRLGISMPVLSKNKVEKQDLEEDWNGQAKDGELK